MLKYYKFIYVILIVSCNNINNTNKINYKKVLFRDITINDTTHLIDKVYFENIFDSNKPLNYKYVSKFFLKNNEFIAYNYSEDTDYKYFVCNKDTFVLYRGDKSFLYSFAINTNLLFVDSTFAIGQKKDFYLKQFKLKKIGKVLAISEEEQIDVLYLTFNLDTLKSIHFKIDLSVD